MNRLTNFYRLRAFFNLHSAFCILLFISCLVIQSCNNHRYADKKIFFYNESSGISSLDPAFAKNKQVMWAVHQLYNTLVEIDSDLNIKPSVARSWEISSDNLIFTFHLRNDVFFQDDPAFKNSNGRKLTARDVVYSFKRIMDPNTASPGAWIFNNRVDTTEPFIAIDDSTFQLRLVKPFQSVLGILSMQYCSILPEEAVKKYGSEFRRHPVGSGPFSFLAWEEGQTLILTKNKKYFEKDREGISLPYLDGIKISFYDSKATEFLEFQQKRLDFIDDIDPSFKDEVLTKTGNLKKGWEAAVNLHKHSYLNIEYLGILVDTTNELVINSPLKIRKIRQAINYGFDKRKLILNLRNSIGIPAEYGFVPIGLPSFDTSVTGYRYDSDRAKQLLSDAGFPAGKKLPVITISTIPAYADIAGFVANELKMIGMDIRIETVQKGLLLQQTAKSQALFFRGSWIADYPDAENYLSVFYSKNPSPPNYTRYCNPEFDKMYEQSLSEKNDSIRYSIYRKMDQMIINDAPVVPLWYDMAIHLVHKNIKNFSPNSLNLLELRRVKKD